GRRRRLSALGRRRLGFLELLARNVVGSQIEAGFECCVCSLFVHLLNLEVSNRDDALILRHLIEERTQACKRALNRNIDSLATVEVLLRVILRRELSDRETGGASAILNSFQDFR